MVLLGWAVRTGPVPIDDWFQRLGSDMGSGRDIFLLFSKPIVVALALLIGVIVAVRQRRTRLALAMVVTPVLAIAVVRIVKPVFGREKEGALAYPSGHTTFLVTVAGLLVVLAGVALWALMVAIAVSLLGILGLSMTFHYFTDTVGAVLLSTAMVCVAAILARGTPHDPVGAASAELR